VKAAVGGTVASRSLAVENLAATATTVLDAKELVACAGCRLGASLKLAAAATTVSLALSATGIMLRATRHLATTTTAMADTEL